MHDSVMDFLRKEVKPEEIAGREVLEIGSQNVNGTPRSVILPMKPSRYVGVDFAPGDGVDLVIDASMIVEHFGPERFDVVISTEMLEHARDWRAAVRTMKGVLRPGGLLVVTTRGPGFPYHGYPHDYWRFTPILFVQIFCDMEIEILSPDPQHPGVLMKAWKHLECSARINLDIIEPGRV
jgi:SAM-dependent methyltransferase